MDVVSLVFLLTIQYAYMSYIEKNNVTLLAIVLVDAAVISTWLSGGITAMGIALFVAILFTKMVEVLWKGVSGYAQNFNPHADSDMRKPFDTHEG